MVLWTSIISLMILTCFSDILISIEVFSALLKLNLWILLRFTYIWKWLLELWYVDFPKDLCGVGLLVFKFPFRSVHNSSLERLSSLKSTLTFLSLKHLLVPSGAVWVPTGTKRSPLFLSFSYLFLSFRYHVRFLVLCHVLCTQGKGNMKTSPTNLHQWS